MEQDKEAGGGQEETRPGQEQKFYYKDSGIEERHGHVPLWLWGVAVALALWGVYYLIVYWSPPV